MPPALRHSRSIATPPATRAAVRGTDSESYCHHPAASLIRDVFLASAATSPDVAYVFDDYPEHLPPLLDYIRSL